jgi:hypothetical protein
MTLNVFPSADSYIVGASKDPSIKKVYPAKDGIPLNLNNILKGQSQTITFIYEKVANDSLFSQSVTIDVDYDCKDAAGHYVTGGFENSNPSNFINLNPMGSRGQTVQVPLNCTVK